ncbi:hypothetical protein CTI12_AA411050 [Artemisia annua]|uniref:Uncharacterized protein n=1 Tax=Artemisia annua TaxID=35608 RepID=A0A2U1M701_ARTAN|nr:hypothetical protein CTI12_AA411050 [Artemisia annua]
MVELKLLRQKLGQDLQLFPWSCESPSVWETLAQRHMVQRHSRLEQQIRIRPADQRRPRTATILRGKLRSVKKSASLTPMLMSNSQVVVSWLSFHHALTSVVEAKNSNHIVRKIEKRQEECKLDPHVDEQFSGGRLLAVISSRPDECRRNINEYIHCNYQQRETTPRRNAAGRRPTRFF